MILIEFLQRTKNPRLDHIKLLFLREIILSHNMGKVVGTKNDLVNNIPTYKKII